MREKEYHKTRSKEGSQCLFFLCLKEMYFALSLQSSSVDSYVSFFPVSQEYQYLTHFFSIPLGLHPFPSPFSFSGLYSASCCFFLTHHRRLLSHDDFYIEQCYYYSFLRREEKEKGSASRLEGKRNQKYLLAKIASFGWRQWKQSYCDERQGGKE